MKEHSKGRRAFIRTTAMTTSLLTGLTLMPGARASDYFLELTGWTQGSDIIVYGATPGGVTAAVAAAREGKSVILIEPLNIVGGVMSGGLSFSDSNQMFRDKLGGLFEEFHLRMEKVYADRGVKLNYQVKIKDSTPWTYEPHVAELVFNTLLREAGVKVILNESLARVIKRNNRIESIKMRSGRKFNGKVFIDASYEGDLMAAAKVSYRVGREGRAEFGESLAGGAYPKKIVNINAIGKDGRLLPHINGTERLAEGQGDHRIMAYCFRLCLTDNPANRVPFSRPENYNADSYELFRRFYKKEPQSRLLIDLYPIPGQKWDGNNGIRLQMSTGLVGENWDYPDASFKRRQEIWDNHVSYTKGLLYFLMTDPDIPGEIRNRMQQLGYAKDEFVNSGHFPPVLYVREGRRMVGAYMLTQSDILEKVKKPDSIGVGSFPIDSHDCQRIAVADGFVNEGTIFPSQTSVKGKGIAYQIPYRCITPKEDECSNLLVPVCASASHVAFCSIRVEPCWMVMGESAGIAAAMSVEKGVSVQQLEAGELALRLKKKRQVLS